MEDLFKKYGKLNLIPGGEILEQQKLKTSAELSLLQIIAKAKRDISFLGVYLVSNKMDEIVTRVDMLAHSSFESMKGMLKL